MRCAFFYALFLRCPFTFTVSMPAIAPATGRVMRSIQLNFTSLNADRAAKIKNVNSIYIKPVIAPFSKPLDRFLKPISVPAKTDRIFIAIFTGNITLLGSEANLMMIANISTKPSEMSVENSTALSTSSKSFLKFIDFSIPKSMTFAPNLCPK